MAETASPFNSFFQILLHKYLSVCTSTLISIMLSITIIIFWYIFIVFLFVVSKAMILQFALIILMTGAVITSLLHYSNSYFLLSFISSIKTLIIIQNNIMVLLSDYSTISYLIIRRIYSKKCFVIFNFKTNKH